MPIKTQLMMKKNLIEGWNLYVTVNYCTWVDLCFFFFFLMFFFKIFFRTPQPGEPRVMQVLMCTATAETTALSIIRATG